MQTLTHHLPRDSARRCSVKEAPVDGGKVLGIRQRGRDESRLLHQP